MLLALARARAADVPQWQVAAWASVSPTLLSFWVHGHRTPRLAEAQRVAEVLGASVEELFPSVVAPRDDVSLAANQADGKAAQADALNTE